MTSPMTTPQNLEGVIELVGRLRAAARNVELARERASAGYLAGWEHLDMRNAADMIERLSSDTRNGQASPEQRPPTRAAEWRLRMEIRSSLMRSF
jgi:hypothetical protein